MAQRHQNRPTVADLVETNRLTQEARKHADTWINVPALTDDLCVVVFHDAAWANAEEPDEGEVPTALWCSKRSTRTPAGVHASVVAGGPPQRLKVRSQAGYLVYVMTQTALRKGQGPAALMDWRSATIRRVCRSTFAAETMSAVDALGAAITLRASILAVTAMGSDLTDPDPRLCPIRCVTDCASLFDTIHRDGAVKLPS